MAAPGELFDVDDLAEFVSDMGQAVEWRKASTCPCIDRTTGGANPTDPVCGGKGYVWKAGENYTMLLVGYDASRMREQYGDMEHGDAVLTIPPFYFNKAKSPWQKITCKAYDELGEFDSIIAAEGTERYDHVAVKGGNEVLPSQRPVALQSVYDVATGAVRSWKVGSEVSLVGRTVTWAPTMGPAADVQYTVTFTARPEFIVVRSLTMLRQHQGGRALPRKVHLRKANLFWAGHGGTP